MHQIFNVECCFLILTCKKFSKIDVDVMKLEKTLELISNILSLNIISIVLKEDLHIREIF